jgi:hypothetical protein
MVVSLDPLTGVNMLFVAFILWVIAGNLRGKVGGKETGFLCILVGSLNFITAVYLLVADKNPLGFGAFLLFAFTYFFFAMDLLAPADTFTGLGNYALGVALTTIPFFILYLRVDTIQAIVWLVWGQLWFLFYLANGRGNKKIVPFMIIDTYCVAIINFVVAIGHHMFGYF